MSTRKYFISEFYISLNLKIHIEWIFRFQEDQEDLKLQNSYWKIKINSSEVHFPYYLLFFNMNDLKCNYVEINI